MSGRNSVVECQLPKLNVDGSIPFARSKVKAPKINALGLLLCTRTLRNRVNHEGFGTA